MSALTAREIAKTVEGVTALCLGDSSRLVWVQATDAAAFNDGERMYLPRPTGQHEGEHALLLSLALKEVAKIKLSEAAAFSGVAPSQMPLAAVLEEARLKRALGNEYRGSAAIFDEGNVIAASLLMHQEGMSAAQAAILAVWAAAHHGFLASTSSEDVANKMRALGHAQIEPTRLDAALGLAAGASACASTAEVVALAQLVASALDEPPPEAAPPQQGGEDEPQQQTAEPESPRGDDSADEAQEDRAQPECEQQNVAPSPPPQPDTKPEAGEQGGDANEQVQDGPSPGSQEGGAAHQSQADTSDGDGNDESPPEQTQSQDGAGEGGESDGAAAGQEQDQSEESSSAPQGGDDAQQQGDSPGANGGAGEGDEGAGDGQGTQAGDGSDGTQSQGDAGQSGEPAAGAGDPSSGPGSDNLPAAAAEPSTGVTNGEGESAQTDAKAVADPLSQALARARGHERASDVSADAQVLQQQGVEQMPTDEALALVEAALADMDPMQKFDDAALALAADGAEEAASQDEAKAVAVAMSGGDGYASGQRPVQDYRLEGVEARLLTVLLRDLQDRRRRPSRMGYSGRVAADQVWRLTALGDTKVFRKRAAVTGVDAAVSVLLDTSGSMGPIIETAVESTFALAQALHRIQGVQVSVDHFPGINQPATELLGFRESVRLAEPRFRALGADGGTPTGRALAARLPSLLTARAERRMVVVVTDGQPNVDEGPILEATMETMRCNDVKVIGIGIRADVSHLFEYSVLIEDVSELPTALEALFKDMVVRLVA